MRARTLRVTMPATLLAIGIPLLWAGSAAAASTLNVAPSGTDTGNCVTATCKTIGYALTQAANGDTINVAAGTYNEHISISKSVSIVGAGAGSTTINAGASASAPASVVVVNVAGVGTPVGIDGVTIRGGFNTFGGGVQLDGGTLTLSQSTITGNTAGGLAKSVGGGGIGVLGTGFGTTPQLVLADSTVAANQTVTFTSGSTTTGYSGAGLYIAGSGPAAPTTITGSTIGANTVTPAGSSLLFGGGIVASVAASGQDAFVTVDSSTISGNSAVLGGGISSVNGSSLTLQNGTQINNNSATDGAGLESTGTVNISGAQIASNTATFEGGGIFEGKLVAADVPQITASGLTLSGNRAAVAGGGAIVSAASGLSMSAGSVDQNNAPVGGGVYIAGSGSGSFSGTDISTNVSGTPSSGGDGAGIFNSGTLSVTNHSTLTRNSAASSSGTTGYGGAIYDGPGAAGDAPTATISDSTIGANTATAGAALAVVGNISAKAGTWTPGNLTASNDTISTNSAADGGGLFNGGNVSLASDTFTANTGSFEGGTIFDGSTVTTDAPSLTMNGTTISGGAAGTAFGGGVFVNSGATLSATGGSISSASAEDGGGLFVLTGGTATLNRTNLTNNVANGGSAANAGNGGAAFNEGALTITNATVSGNSTVASTGGGTTGEGGAVFSGASATTNVPKPAVTTSLSNDTFTANTSKTASVLLTFSSAGTNQTSISNSTMTGNSTSGGSGTIVSFHALSIVQSTITSNTSTTASGGVYLLSSDSVSGSILAGNSGGNCGITSPWAAPTDGGYNLTDPADTSCGFTPANHDLATNPQLGALADNGGPTQTQLPSASSPVVNVIPTGTTTTATDGISGNAITLCGSGATDQRGVARPQGPACDIGAVELVNQAPGLTGPSAATYQVNVAGTPQTFTSTGIPTPTLAETGSLPSGVTFKDNGDGTATLSGTPVLGTTGTYPITITASNGNTPDASLPFTLTVDAPPVLSGPTGARFVVASAGSVSVTATGFPVPTLHEAGTLPAGLTFTDNGNGTATIAGTPAAGSAGHYPVTITATNGVSPDASETLTITVNPAVSITTTSLPAGAVGVTYSTNLAAAGGLSPYTWSITSGSLPPGLTMSPSGAITGSPAGPVTTSTFTVKVVDALRPAGTATRQLTLTIAKGPTSLAVQPVLVHSGVLTVTTASARLTGGSPAVGLQGQTVTFSSGTTKICSGITNTNGNVTCSIPAGDTALLVLRGSITGTYAGSALWKPASGSAGVTT